MRRARRSDAVFYYYAYLTDAFCSTLTTPYNTRRIRRNDVGED